MLPFEQQILDFKFGTIDFIGEENIPAGSASASNNFKTRGDKVELTGGNYNLGATIDGDSTPSQGVHVAFRRDKQEVLIRKRGRKIEIYDQTANVWNEAGTDILPVGAVDDEMSLSLIHI